MEQTLCDCLKMERVKGIHKKIKEAYKGWQVISPVSAFASLILIVCPNLLSGSLIKIRMAVVILCLGFTLFPAFKLLINSTVVYIKNGIKYPKLLTEHSKVINDKELLITKNHELEEIQQSLLLLIDKLLMKINKENMLEIDYAYPFGSDTYIVVSNKYETIIHPNTKCVLTDRVDGYNLGFFSNPITKADGIHLKSCDNQNPVLKGVLKSNNIIKLRPTTIALILTEEEDS